MAKVGRPLKFENVEMIQPAIDEYFAETPEEEWTITGLALALDFTSRRQLIEYSERPEFHNTIKRAKLKIEYAYEKHLRKSGHAGDIFALKNFDWSDQRQIDHTTNGKDLPTPILGGASAQKEDDDDEVA